MMSNIFCLWSLKWSHLIINQEKYAALLQKHPHTQDGYIHIVGAILTDETGRIYMHHNAKLNEFLLPWWKVEIWESFEEALVRECKEELNIDIEDMTHLSSVKYIAGWVRRCFHMFQVHTYTGIPINNEKKYDQYRAKKVFSDNTFWFGICIDGTITEDEQDIMHTFLDLYHISVVAPNLEASILLEGTYLPYDESLIDCSKHYYLWFDEEKKEYILQLHW